MFSHVAWAARWSADREGLRAIASSCAAGSGVRNVASASCHSGRWSVLAIGVLNVVGLDIEGRA